MARITRRNFVQASGALALAPALATVTAQAQPPPPDIGNLRAEKDIVFGKGGGMDLTLDVYQPPAGVTSKRVAIVHLFGGGFFVGNKNAGYIVNDAKALGARGYVNVSANYRLQQQSPWPAQLHDVKAAIRWTRANASRLGVEPNRI
ncbi:MAG TPA: alpha/beta hydrolase, partial [Gammaproteobacteria bacterium]|nr:alpha/beta hydrolase [Gammaproteobacteria bacterium]